MVGDGAYVVADGDQINVGYPQIEPGVYVSAGEAVFGATYQLFGHDGNSLLLQGAGLFGEVTIVIPRMCWVFQTTGMEDWVKIDDPPTLWLRMPNATWFNLTDPQPGAPADLISGDYNAYQLRMRSPNLVQWFYQAADFIPLRIRMPDGYWLNVTNFGLHPDSGSPDPGFMLHMGSIGTDSTGLDTNKPAWYVHQSTTGIDVSTGFAGMVGSYGIFNEVETPMVGDPEFNIRREYFSVDLNLVRWAARAFDPSNDFTLSLRFSAGVVSQQTIGGVTSPGGWGEATLATATGSVVDTDTYPSTGYQVSGQYVSRISLTGEPIAGSAIHTFTEGGDIWYDYPISLPALEGSRSLEFEHIPVTPDTPAPGDSARVDSVLSIYLAFNP